jgi:hypothetical protein
MNSLKNKSKVAVVNIILYIGMSVNFWSCSSAQKKLVIVPLPTRDYIDTSYFRGKQAISKIAYYIVQGYKNNKRTEKLIDSLVPKIRDSNFSDYSHYEVVLYKESNQTNIKNIKAFPRVIDRYSQDHDWIYSYKWSEGQLLYKWKIKKGKIIKPKQNIKLEDIPN